MKSNIIMLCLLCFYGSICFAQEEDDKVKALKIATEAVKIMDEGKYDESIALLKKAMALDPDRIEYPYEIGYALYSQKKYKKAIKFLEKYIDHKNVTQQHFQLIGNSYDYLKKPDKALETYKKGLEKFPKSGKLHLEQGIVEYLRENYDEAIKHWENGVEVDPTFSSNYYWLGKLFSRTEERIWAVHYAEVFINLERSSERTMEMSEILFNTYVDAIDISSDSTGGVSFSKTMTIDPTADFKIPFQMSYGLVMSISMATDLGEGNKTISIGYLNNLRQNFITNWFGEINKERQPNLLYDFHQTLYDKGFFEVYNYWILMKGNEDEFEKWYESNEEKFKEFANWFMDNPLEITEENYFSRRKY